MKLYGVFISFLIYFVLYSKSQTADLLQNQMLDKYQFQEKEFVFQDSSAFLQCHASTLAQLGPGRFLVAWFGGSGEGHPDVGIWTSQRNSEKWSPPRLTAKVNNEAHWNPVLFNAPNGILYLFFKVGKNPSRWHTWVITSKDQGTTWASPVELVLGDSHPRGPVKNKPIVLSNGWWLAPSSIEHLHKWDVFVDTSRDEGKTWNRSKYVKINHWFFGGRGVIQPTLWESKPGHVHMLMRSSNGHIYRSDSSDYGQTWCPVYPTDLPTNNSGLDLVKMPDGALILGCNPVPNGYRSPLTILISYNNGTSWISHLNLETDKGEYSYPSIISTDTGFALTYTWKKKRIVFQQAICK